MARMTGLAPRRTFRPGSGRATIEGLARWHTARLCGPIGCGEDGSRGLETTQFLSKPPVLLLELFQALELSKDLLALLPIEGNGSIPLGGQTNDETWNSHPFLKKGGYVRDESTFGPSAISRG
jgi:hypothetical protein